MILTMSQSKTIKIRSKSTNKKNQTFNKELRQLHNLN